MVLVSTPLLAVLVVRFVFRFGDRSIAAVLPLFVASIAPSSERVTSLTGLVTGVNAAAGALGAYCLGQLGDRRGHERILLVGALVAAVSYGAQYLVNSPACFLPLQAAGGLAMGGILTSIGALVAKTVVPGREGMGFGLSGTAACMANALGPMTGSAVAACLGLRVPFLLAASAFIMAGLVVVGQLRGRAWVR
jgi:MFS transporter, DHA1 family, multidrug resistance protein